MAGVLVTLFPISCLLREYSVTKLGGIAARVWRTVTISIAVFVATGTVSGQERARQVVADAAAECSIFDVMCLSAASIQSGDVLVEVTSNIDTINSSELVPGQSGVFEATTQTCRCVFDVEHSRYFMARKEGPNSRIDMSDLSGNATETPSRYRGWSIDFSKKRLFLAGRNEPAPWRLADSQTLPETLVRFQYLDPRSVAWIPSPGLAESGFGMIRSLSSGKDFWDKKLVEDRLLRLTLFNGRFEDGSEMVTWEFDLKNSLPVAYAEKAWHLRDGKFYDGRSGKMKWQEIDGNYVIVEKSFDSFDGLRAVDGKEYFGRRTTVTRLTWVSVNEPVDDKYFDSSVLATEGLLRSCFVVSGGKTGASPATKGGAED